MHPRTREHLISRIRDFVRDVPDFPKPGILFRDITPALADAVTFEAIGALLLSQLADHSFEAVVGIEARGFILAAMIAPRRCVGFIPVRKPGKLPVDSISDAYGLEYGSITPFQRVVLVDDLLASGGTMLATAKLVRRLGGEVVSCLFLIELSDMKGRERLEAEGLRVDSVVVY